MEIVDTAWDGRHYQWFYVSPDSELADLHFDSSDVITDSGSDSDDVRINWVVRQRQDEREESSSSAGNVRRSPRLAAQRRTQPQTKTTRTSQRRPRPPQWAKHVSFPPANGLIKHLWTGRIPNVTFVVFFFFLNGVFIGWSVSIYYGQCTLHNDGVDHDWPMTMMYFCTFSLTESST